MPVTSEQEIAEAVLRILASNGKGKATYAELRIEVPKIINFTSADLAPSGTRPGETMWQQRLRNITSHKNAEGNFIKLGLLAEIDSGLEITQAGRDRVIQEA